MREALRLAYLDALGVSNWVPRRPLARAAPRQPPELEVADLAGTTDAVAEPVSSAGTPARTGEPSGGEPAGRHAPNQTEAVEAVRAAVGVPRNAEPAVDVAKPRAEPAAAAPALASFYLQLWQAGPCILMLEVDEPGLQVGTATQRLFGDIVRAAELPSPSLLADFRWPLFRNQADRSAAAASDGLLAFLQARLEGVTCESVGCFGAMAGLVSGSEVEQVASLYGREEALEGLPPTWFAPDLEQLMRDPQGKAQLWTLIKRVKRRWITQQ